MPLHDPVEVRAAPYRGALTTDERAADDRAIGHSLHLKHDAQLAAMHVSHDTKRARMAAKRLQAFTYPDSIRWPLIEAGKGQAKADAAVVRAQLTSDAKVTQLLDIVAAIESEIAFRDAGLVERDPLGTKFFIDADAGNNGNDGLTVGNAWADFHEFTQNARAAGDRAVARRGTVATYDDASANLTFTSDGDIGDPIVLEADYDDDFGDEVDLSATATATLVIGSTTVLFTATVAAVLSIGDWIYALGDNNRLYAYEVANVVTTTVTLFRPYKGGQTGSGVTMFNMQANPKWDDIADNFVLWNMFGDNFWLFRGVSIAGESGTGQLLLDTSTGISCWDTTIGDSRVTASISIYMNSDGNEFTLNKCRLFNYVEGITTASSDAAFVNMVVRDTLFDGDNVANSRGIRLAQWCTGTVIESDFQNHATGDIDCLAVGNGSNGALLLMRNCNLTSATPVNAHDAAGARTVRILIEDYNNVLGDNRQLTHLSSAEGVPTIQSETGTTRAGGGDVSIKVTPSDKLGAVEGYPHGLLTLFERAIDLPAEAKTLTVFFASDNIGEWTVGPTASELYVEVEYWGHATNDVRIIERSTGTVDFTTDTDFDQSLAVTMTPAQAGLAIFRVLYGKPKEVADANIFYVDPQVVIS